MLEKVVLKIKQREEIAKEFIEYMEQGATKPPAFKLKDIEKRKILQQSVVTG